MKQTGFKVCFFEFALCRCNKGETHALEVAVDVTWDDGRRSTWTVAALSARLAECQVGLHSLPGVVRLVI